MAAGLLYGQVKKTYRRRKLVRVTAVLRCGTRATVQIALQGLGFSGRLNTAFVERVNLILMRVKTCVKSVEGANRNIHHIR